MVRLIGFFLLVFAACFVLRELPVVGALFRIHFLGFWLSAILVSAALSRVAVALVDRRKLRSHERTLGAVQTPHNQGKLGVLLSGMGRYQRALEALERAAAGEPDVAEWHYRLGLAYLQSGRAADAAQALNRALAVRSDHAYGQPYLRLAEAEARAGVPERSLSALQSFESTYGATPESAYRRGLALRQLGQSAEARQAMGEVPLLWRNLARYQRKGAWRFPLLAFINRF